MKCQGLAGLLFGHKYKPRYSEGAPSISDVQGVGPIGAERVINASKKRTYERDICERCGHVIEKGGA